MSFQGTCPRGNFSRNLRIPFRLKKTDKKSSLLQSTLKNKLGLLILKYLKQATSRTVASGHKCSIKSKPKTNKKNIIKKGKGARE